MKGLSGGQGGAPMWVSPLALKKAACFSLASLICKLVIPKNVGCISRIQQGILPQRTNMWTNNDALCFICF